MLGYTRYDTDNRVKRYAETLVRLGHNVDVISYRIEGQGCYEQINGVNVYRIQLRSHNEKGKCAYLLNLITFLVNSAIILTKMHLSNPYHLIHVHSVPDFEVFAAFIPKLTGARIILDIHDIVPEFYASKFAVKQSSIGFEALIVVERAAIAFADHVIISNHIWKKRLVSRSVKENKCTVILNLPDQTTFYRRHSKKHNSDKFTLMYPGTLSWHQGVDIAVKAFAKIADSAPNAVFLIYGNGPQRKQLEKLVRDLRLVDRVFIMGLRAIEEIAEIMAEADLGIVPKRNDPFGGEAFSTKILEFMSLGIPVLVSETKIDRFYFNDSLVKFFSPEDEDDLARAMLSLIKSKASRDLLVRNAEEFVKANTWDSRKGEYLDILGSLLG